MNKKQKVLFDKAMKLGFNKPEAHFHVIFHESALRKFLDSKKVKRQDCWEPSLKELAEVDKDLTRVKKTRR